MTTDQHSQLRDSAGIDERIVIANEANQAQFRLLRHTSTGSVCLAMTFHLTGLPYYFPCSDNSEWEHRKYLKELVKSKSKLIYFKIFNPFLSLLSKINFLFRS